MKTIIHVNQHVIKRNRKLNTQDPVITVKTYKGTIYAQSIEIHGPSTVIYSPNNPLACGAHVWIETNAKVTIK